MLRRLHILLGLALSVATAACAGDGWKRLQEEYPEVRANCGLKRAVLHRDAKDKGLLRLTFPQRYNAGLQARQDGSLACVEHWARERGWRLTTLPGGEGVR